MIYTPEDKIHLLAELSYRAGYYEREIAACERWKQNIGRTDVLATMLENAYANLAIVNSLIAKTREM